MDSYFYLTYFREVGQKYRIIFVCVLVQMKTSKSHSEIIWPLQNEERTAVNRDLLPEKPVFEKAKFEKALRYKCQLCDNTNVYFNEIDELKEHINAIHRTTKLEREDKRFKCSLCESKFPRSNDLRSHISSVHEGIEAVSTGKSLSEALIFVSTNRQYDNRLFIELRLQCLKRVASES